MKSAARTILILFCSFPILNSALAQSSDTGFLSRSVNLSEWSGFGNILILRKTHNIQVKRDAASGTPY